MNVAGYTMSRSGLTMPSTYQNPIHRQEKERASAITSPIPGISARTVITQHDPNARIATGRKENVVITMSKIIQSDTAKNVSS
jgi:hypothetical protein